MKQKEVVILNHNGGQLANQLWNDISIYAYSLESGYLCRNYCFFEYAKDFSILSEQRGIHSLFFRAFPVVSRVLGFPLTKKIWRRSYRFYVKWIRLTRSRSILYSRTTEAGLGTYFLPPSIEPSNELAQAVLEEGALFFDGWLFRNPEGIQKYREQILSRVKPRREIESLVQRDIESIRKVYPVVIGVHIRQGDYREFKNGRFFIHQSRIREILEEYMVDRAIDRTTTCFVLCTNGEIQSECFDGLNIWRAERGFVHDLFLLAACDVILGSDSTFGAFASYYGDVPHVVFQKGVMDWSYYKGKNRYFENKYCLTVCSDPTLWNGR